MSFFDLTTTQQLDVGGNLFDQLLYTVPSPPVAVYVFGWSSCCGVVAVVLYSCCIVVECIVGIV